MKLERKIKFPCGYSVESKFGGYTMVGSFDEDFLPECPMHGQKCKR